MRKRVVNSKNVLLVPSNTVWKIANFKGSTILEADRLFECVWLLCGVVDCLSVIDHFVGLTLNVLTTHHTKSTQMKNCHINTMK